MRDEKKKWISTQIEVYEKAISIARRLNNGEKLQEYEEALKKLKEDEAK